MSSPTVPVRRVAPNTHGEPDYLNWTEKKLQTKFDEESAEPIKRHLSLLIDAGFIKEANDLLKIIDRY